MAMKAREVCFPAVVVVVVVLVLVIGVVVIVVAVVIIVLVVVVFVVVNQRVRMGHLLCIFSQHRCCSE